MKSVNESVDEVLNAIDQQENKAVLVWYVEKDNGIGVLNRIALVKDDFDNSEKLLKIALRDFFECFIESSDGKEWLRINGEELRRQFTNMALRFAGY